MISNVASSHLLEKKFKIKQSFILIISKAQKIYCFQERVLKWSWVPRLFFSFAFYNCIYTHTHTWISIFLRTIDIKFKNHNCFSNQLGGWCNVMLVMVFNIHVM
jgi:hypothetical protein